jgi:hypothetical protein
MAVLGLGVGMVMQNLVLVVQNSVPFSQMGAASALIAFFRSLGGAAGVSVLGAILASQVTSSIASGLTAIGVPAGKLGSGSGTLPDVNTLPGPVRAIVEHGYGTGIGEIFLLAATLGLVALVAIAMIKEVPLGTMSGVEAALAENAAADAGVRSPEPVAT